MLDLYETHEDSPYQRLKPSSRHPYSVYLRILRQHVGGRLVVNLNGLDVRQWWKIWADEHGRNPRKVAAGHMAFRVFKEAVRFGVACGIDDCIKLWTGLSALRFPRPRPRSMVATAKQVIAARKEAHRIGRKSLALAYAIQFETVLRQWDVIGQWYPFDYPGVVSDVIGPDGKWAGLEWRHIDAKLILRLVATKTENTTKSEHVVD